MADTIVQSVIAHWAASGSSDFSTAGGMWFLEVPELKALPFLVLEAGPETCEFTTEREYLERGSLTIHAYGIGVAVTEALALTVKGVFDRLIKTPRTLDFTGGTVTEWERTGYTISPATGPDENGKQVGEARMDYRYAVVRTLPA